MEEFKLTEDEIVFTPEQLDKVNQLRAEREKNNIKAPKGEAKPPFSLKNGDPVYVSLKGTRFTGKIENVIESKWWWDTKYDVSTPHGILKDLERNQVTKRHLQDLSAIEVPEVLKDLPAHKLLKLLRSTYTSTYEYGDPGIGYAWYQGKSYSDLQIKAALIGKPHVTNRRERQKVKEHKKKSK